MPSTCLRFSLPVAAALLAAACHPAAPPSPLVPAPEAGTVVLPPDYDSLRAYPVVEILPATGSTSETLLQTYLGRVGLGRMYRDPPERQLEALLPYFFPDTGHVGRDFIVVLVHGRGSRGDYRTQRAWEETVARYERRVLADLRWVAATMRVDTTRLVLAGLSLGGDLAWAIALRNPGLIHGAIVMASRASYRPDPDAARTLASSGVRFFLTMGDEDDGTRQRLARAAAAMLDRLGVPYRFRVLPRTGHEPAPPDVFAEALDFVLSP